MTFHEAKIFFLTKNLGKFEEASEVLGRFGIEVLRLSEDKIEIQSDDLCEISKFSSLEASRAHGIPLITEDAGLFVDSLGGFPGPYSSYVFRTIGVSGLLKLLDGVSDRGAEFKSAVSFCAPGFGPLCFLGIVRGRISEEARGSQGFGFDPIFIPDGEGDRTFAEMGLEEKNKYSHRAKALEKFARWFKGEWAPQSRCR
ncbi:MAG: XTP/dITP diphosphatase [Candidatus Bathyarchaeia archaeon]